MTFTPTIFRNIKLLTVAQLMASIAGLFSSAILARALGADGFGVLGFGISVVSFLGIAASLRTDVYGTREIARDHSKTVSIASSIIGLRLILSVSVFIIFIGIVYLLDRSQSEKIVLIIQAGSLFVSLFVLDFVFQGLERMGINGFRQILVAFVTLAGIFFFVKAPEDLLIAATIPVIAGVLAVSVVWIYAKMNSGLNISGLGLTFSPARWRSILSVSVPVAISGLMSAIVFNTDAVMLGLMSTNEQTGLYVSAFKIVGLTLVPVGLLTAPFFPSLSVGWNNQALRYERSKSFTTSVLIFSLPLVFFIALFPDLILSVFFGTGFVDAAAVLVILMLSMVMVHFRIIYGYPLVAWNDERFLMVVTIIGATLNVFLNLILIPDYGILGAAYASLISQIVIVLGVAYRFKAMTNALHLKIICRSFLCIVIAAIGAWIMEASIGHSFVDNTIALMRNVIVFGLIYLMAIIFLFKPNMKQLFNVEK
jgi:O-antigen/teichoic acid export membrane protein